MNTDEPLIHLEMTEDEFDRSLDEFSKDMEGLEAFFLSTWNSLPEEEKVHVVDALRKFDPKLDAELKEIGWP